MSEAYIKASTQILDFPSFRDAVLEAQSQFGRKVWYRGHADGAWNLRPTVFRPIEDRGFDNHYEMALATQFKAQSLSRSKDCPVDDAYFEWLAFMRHYELPCRLLDWTGSILFAAFFAVTGNEVERAPAIWVIDPYSLNGASCGKRSPVQSNEGRVDDMARWAFQGVSAPNDASCIFVTSRETTQRMMVQRGAFTIHASGTPAEMIKRTEPCFMRFDIEIEFAKLLREWFEAVAIDESALFPELSELAKRLVLQEIDPSSGADVIP